MEESSFSPLAEEDFYFPNVQRGELQTKPNQYNGQGGFMSGLRAVGRDIMNVLSSPVRAFSNLKEAVTKENFPTNMYAKYIGSSTGESLRDITKTSNYFSPDVQNEELATANFRQAQNEKAPYGGYFIPLENKSTGLKNKNTFLKKIK